MSKIRLDKFISNQLNFSRSKAVSLIRSGKVRADGVIIKQPSFSFDTAITKIYFEDKPIEYKSHLYFILNKPKGILSASTDKSRKTVVDLIPENLRRQGLAPVGRLDKDTTGLLIITDDGDFAHNCISPKKMIPKTYIATLDGEIKKEHIIKFEKGVVLADGTVCMPAKLIKLSENKASVTVYEGKYHQIKRMFGTVGLGVNELHRKSVGLLNLPKNLKEGEIKEVNLEYLQKMVINYKQIVS